MVLGQSQSQSQKFYSMVLGPVSRSPDHIQQMTSQSIGDDITITWRLWHEYMENDI